MSKKFRLTINSYLLNAAEATVQTDKKFDDIRDLIDSAKILLEKSILSDCQDIMISWVELKEE